MGIFLTAVLLLVVVYRTLGADLKVIMGSESWSEEGIAPHSIQVAEKLFNPNPCTSKKTCGECIRAHYMCAWCASKDMKDISDGGRPRCYWIGSYKCPVSDTVDLTSKAVVVKPGAEWDVFLKPNIKRIIDFSRNIRKDAAYMYFLHGNVPRNVEVIFLLRCSGEKLWQKKNFCEDLKKGDIVMAEIIFKLHNCSEKRDEYNRTIWIHIRYPAGFGDMNIKVNFHMLCECPCESPEIAERHSRECSGRGTYHCGVCSCPENWYGKNCECEGKPIENADHQKQCILPGDTKICSGRGRCRCGFCECFNKTSVTGHFCECDSYSCARSEDGQICGGKDRGRCVCGRCECTGEWTGPTCDCKKDHIKACRSPYNHLICHGLGECKCGRCHCFEGNGTLHSGTYCEECATCPLKCEKYQRCVRCSNYH